MEDKRSFKIVSAKKANGCNTKFPAESRFISRTPASAAKKALTALCSVKKIRGVCTLYITVKETTRGSSGKHFTYICKRKKLRTPKVIKNKSGKVMYKVEYESVCKAHKSKVKVKKGVVCKKTSGVMSKKSKLKRRQKGGKKNKNGCDLLNDPKKKAKCNEGLIYDVKLPEKIFAPRHYEYAKWLAHELIDEIDNYIKKEYWKFLKENLNIDNDKFRIISELNTWKKQIDYVLEKIEEKKKIKTNKFGDYVIEKYGDYVTEKYTPEEARADIIEIRYRAYEVLKEGKEDILKERRKRMVQKYY